MLGNTECVRSGVREIAIGDLCGIREITDYGDWLNQHLHAWPYRKLINMLKYKGALAGILVRNNIEEVRPLLVTPAGRLWPPTGGIGGCMYVPVVGRYRQILTVS
ncbi:MAG: IS200/IS605 family accessory protein TnpB-related protein [Caldicoprobacter oshimai]